MTRFSRLLPDGTEVNVREIDERDILKCPHYILMAEHFRMDGSCKCKGDDADAVAHREVMRDEWGYTDEDIG